MSAHSPGPWLAREWKCHAPTSVMDSGWNHVAECVGPVAEACRNARLVAAAPELRDALIDLNALIAAWRVTGKPELALIAAAQERADAALAKADPT